MKRLFAMLLIMLPLTVMSQAQFGYLSYKQVMVQMPEYTKAQADFEQLKQKYEQEALKGEEDFQRKFVEFLQGQKDFPLVIMQKRQAELQQMLENGITFRLQVEKLLEQAEKDLMSEVEKRLNQVILEIGVELNYAFVLNTDGNSCPFVNPVVGVDVTIPVLRKLGIAVMQPESPATISDAPMPVPQNDQPGVPVEVKPEEQPTAQ